MLVGYIPTYSLGTYHYRYMRDGFPTAVEFLPQV